MPFELYSFNKSHGHIVPLHLQQSNLINSYYSVVAKVTSTQRVLRPLPKATIHNKCGLLMCAMAGLEAQTLACKRVKV